ncbi:MAG: TrkA family potassium uptake protein, partial [Desulfovibrionaceae bacterium]
SLLALGHHVTLVNADAAESAWLARHIQATVVHADGSVPAELGEAGATEADVLLAASRRDEDNLVICQAASVLFGVRRVLALVRDPEMEPVFRALGVEAAFSLNRVLTELLERRVVDRNVRDLIPLGEGQASLTEIELGPKAPAAGRTLAQLALPADSLVACVFRDATVLIPRGDTELRAGDRLVVLAMPGNHAAVLRRLAGA